MEVLIKTLTERNIQNALIVMDNAKYYCYLPESTPNGNWLNNDLQAACECYSLMHRAIDTKTMIWGILKQYIKANIWPVVCTMTEAADHEVVFSPPYHSDLQPLNYFE